MKIEDAIIRIKEIPRSYGVSRSEEDCKAIDMAVNAMEVTREKKVLKIKDVKFTGCIKAQFKSGECPNCKEYVNTDDDSKFCGECGQKLKW